MSGEHTHTDELIAKALSGNAGKEELRELREWMAEDTANKEAFRQSEMAYLRTFQKDESFSPDVESAWKKIEFNVKEPSEVKAGRIIGGDRFARRMWLRAAVMVGILAATWWWWSRTPDTIPAVYAAVNEIRLDTLSAGVVTKLDKGGTIRYSHSDNRHELTLEGRGYFDVQKRPDETLVVMVGELEIMDIGTEFMVDATRPDSILVSVQSGIVSLNSPLTKDNRVLAGESVVYLTASGKVSRLDEETSDKVRWSGREFDFRQTPLRRVVKRLNEVYDMPVELQSELIAECKITVSFYNEELPTIVGVIAETLGLTLREEDGRFILSGETCN